MNSLYDKEPKKIIVRIKKIGVPSANIMGISIPSESETVIQYEVVN